MGRTGSGRWAFLNVLKVIFFFLKQALVVERKTQVGEWGRIREVGGVEPLC